MRPYRARRKDNNEWVYGWYIKTDFADYIVPAEYVVNWKVFIEVHPASVAQSTGKHDKNGDEIFEGDRDKDKGIVKWSEYFAGFVLTFTDENGKEIDDDISLQDSKTWFEIIPEEKP